MKWTDLYKEATKVFRNEARLIILPLKGRAVFVGDTHGDLKASREVIRRFLRKLYVLVFLGDYVDRGENSRANIQYLLSKKLEYPDKIFLLAGNHEGFMKKEVYPADFWGSLTRMERRQFGWLFSRLPLAATSQNGVLALHGALPDLKFLREINQIKPGDKNWERIVWGDFEEVGEEGSGSFYGRPQFDRTYFEGMMKRFQKRVLIRSHQSNAPLTMFDERCITIFTSDAYPRERTIAIVNLAKEARTAEDVVIERI
jgi:predicted phosphodiesterase